MYINSWDANTRVLQSIVYYPDPDTHTYDKASFQTIDLNYFAGTDLKFVCSGNVDSNGTTFGFTMRFKGVKTSGNFVLGGSTNLTTLGGYYVERDNVSPFTERWAGSIAFTGNMIPLTKVPSALK